MVLVSVLSMIIHLIAEVMNHDSDNMGLHGRDRVLVSI